MSRVDQHLQHSVMGLLGSFWSRAVTESTKSQARAIATLAANAADLRRLDVPFQKMSSESYVTVDRVRVPFLDGDFVYVGTDLTASWRSTLGLEDGTTLQIVRRDLSYPVPKSQLLIGSNGRPLGMDLGHLLAVTAGQEGETGIDSLYIIPIPAHLTPIVIATRFPDHVLVQGIDFETGPGYIIMRESPGEVFNAGGFTVLTGYQDLRLPYDFTMQVNGPAFGHQFIASYYKGSNSRASFERAAAQACGMLVLEEDDTLVQAFRLSDDTTRYVFLKRGVTDVSYPHEALEPGRDYVKGHIVSNGFRIVSGSTAGWLRRAVGDRTVSLTGVTSIPDTYLPAEMLTAYHSESGASPHARVVIRGTEASLLAYWWRQKQHELSTGLYLSDTIGMTAEQPRVAIDMHALIETFYGRRLLLVLPELGGAHPSYLYRLKEFVMREKPVGAAVLFAEEPVDLPPTGFYQPGGTIDGIVIYSPPTGDIPFGALEYDGHLLEYDAGILTYVGP